MNNFKMKHTRENDGNCARGLGFDLLKKNYNQNH